MESELKGRNEVTFSNFSCVLWKLPWYYSGCEDCSVQANCTLRLLALTIRLLFQIEIRHNVPSPKNESCLFAIKIETREEIKEGKEDAVPIMGRSRERRDEDERERKAKKCRKNKKKKSCKKKRKNQKYHKRPKTDAKPPDSLHLKICARWVIIELHVFNYSLF